MRTRSLRRSNRSEGPCGKACRIEGLRNHKLPPPAYSRAEESARSLNGRRDDDLSKMRSSRVLTSSPGTADHSIKERGSKASQKVNESITHILLSGVLEMPTPNGFILRL